MIVIWPPCTQIAEICLTDFISLRQFTDTQCSCCQNYTLRDEKWSSMSFTLCENKKTTATDSRSGYHKRTLTDIHIPYKNTQYISTTACTIHTHTVTTHMSCSLELSIFSSFCTATLTPQSSRQFCLWMCSVEKRFVTLCLISGRRGGRRKGILQYSEDEQPKRTPSTHLSIYPSLESGLTN